MPCYRPVKAYQPLEGGAVLFVERKNTRTVTVRCGGCIGCRLDRQAAWATRCYAESKCHTSNSFVTLTYNAEHYPMHGSLSYRDWQLFAKRLRKKIGAFRFFVAGEYGEDFQRPHFHALLFGVDFSDKRKSNSMYSRHTIYQSEMLDGLWGKGFCSIGEVNYATARYTTSYIVDSWKLGGCGDDSPYRTVDDRTGEIVDRVPPFAKMSLRPGIGLKWLEQYWKDLYLTGHDAVIVNGKKEPIPRYFDKKMYDLKPQLMEEVEWSREKAAIDRWADNTPERLKVKEDCAIARKAFNNERRLR